MRLAPGPRKAVTVLHVLSSVGFAGATAAVLTLALAGAERRSVELVAGGVSLPLVVAALLTGLVSALFTPWGLLKHGWVVVKLGLLLVMLAVALVAAGSVAGTVGQLALLLLSTVLSVFKPRGIVPGTR